MRKLFKERKLFKGGNYMRKYGKSSMYLKFQALHYMEAAYISFASISKPKVS